MNADLITRKFREDRKYPIPSLADHVYDHVIRGIIAKEYILGERLPENKIAKEMDVSTVPVRDAMQKLHQDGWIDRIPYKGAIVVNLAKREVFEELFITRHTIEQGAAYQAVRLITQADIAELRKFAEDYSHFNDMDPLEKLGQEIRFHGAVVALCGSPRIASLFEPIMLQIFALNLVIQGYPKKSLVSDLLESHNKIIDVLAEGDGYKAANQIVEHTAVKYRFMAGLLS
jgi:DNA-binding GntR family transcriptional regulator